MFFYVVALMYILCFTTLETHDVTKDESHLSQQNKKCADEVKVKEIKSHNLLLGFAVLLTTSVNMTNMGCVTVTEKRRLGLD